MIFSASLVALQNLDPFSSSAPNEPSQRDDIAFNPLAQATAIRESLSQLPGVASSVFSSFSSILKGTAPQERTEDTSYQYTGQTEPDQYQSFYEPPSFGQDLQQTADVPPVTPAFYSPTDPNLVRPEASLSPASHDSNLYRLKERKKHYAQIPGLNANQLNAPAGIVTSPVPAAPAIQPLPVTSSVDQAPAKANNSFSLSSFFGAPLLDKIQETVLPKKDDTQNTYGYDQVAPLPIGDTFSTQFPQQAPQQDVPFIQTDAKSSLSFGQPVNVPLASPASFNLSPYQLKPTQNNPASIAPLTAQLQQTHLSSQPGPPSFAPFNPSASPALASSPAPGLPPTNIAPPSASAEPSNYRLRGKVHYKRPADYNPSYQASAAYPNSAALFNAPTVASSAVPSSVQIFNPSTVVAQPQTFGQPQAPTTQVPPVQLFNPATLPTAAPVLHPFVPPVEQLPPPPPPSQQTLFGPEAGANQPQFFAQSAASPIQFFNPTAPPTSEPAVSPFVAPVHGTPFVAPPTSEPAVSPFVAPVQVLPFVPPPTSEPAVSPFLAPVQDLPPPPQVQYEQKPEVHQSQANQPQFFEQVSAHSAPSPNQFFNPAALSTANPVEAPFETSVQQLPPPPQQSQLEPTFDDHQTQFIREAHPHSAPSPIPLFNPAIVPPVASLFAAPVAPEQPPQQFPTKIDEYQPSLLSETTPPTASSPIQLFSPTAPSTASPAPFQAEQPPQQSHFDHFRSTVQHSQTFAELPQQHIDPSPIQFFNPAEQPQVRPPVDPFQASLDKSQPQLFSAVQTSSTGQSAPSPIQLFSLASPTPPLAQTPPFASTQEQVTSAQAPPEATPPPFQLFNPVAPFAEQPHFDQFAIENQSQSNTFNLFSQATVAEAPVHPTTSGPQLQSFFGPSGDSRRSIDASSESTPYIAPSLSPTEAEQPLETFQTALPTVYAEPLPLSPFGLTPASNDTSADIELDYSANTSETQLIESNDWTADSENNNQFYARRFSTSNASEPQIDVSDVSTGSLVDANANVEQQSLFNDLPPLSEVQKDEQDKNFNIIRTNLLNKRIESIASVNRTDNENTESLSIASVIVEPASSAQSEISEYATELITRSLGEAIEATIVSIVSFIRAEGQEDFEDCGA